MGELRAEKGRVEADLAQAHTSRADLEEELQAAASSAREQQVGCPQWHVPIW